MCRTLVQTTGFLIEVLERILIVYVDASLVTPTSPRAAAHSCAGIMKGAVRGHGAVLSAPRQDRILATYGNHLVRDTAEGAGRVRVDRIVVDSRRVGEDGILDDRICERVPVSLLKGHHHLLDLSSSNERRLVG